MHTTRIKLKDGSRLAGSIAEWRPKDGYFVLADTENENDGDVRKILLIEVESAITSGQRISAKSPPEGEDQDELARARSDGWNPG
jgi:hypothetical protein